MLQNTIWNRDKYSKKFLERLYNIFENFLTFFQILDAFCVNCEGIRGCRHPKYQNFTQNRLKMAYFFMDFPKVLRNTVWHDSRYLKILLERLYSILKIFTLFFQNLEAFRLDCEGLCGCRHQKSIQIGLKVTLFCVDFPKLPLDAVWHDTRYLKSFGANFGKVFV